MPGEEIKAWIKSGKDWKQGVELYQKYGIEVQFNLRLKRSPELPLIKQILYDKLKVIMAQQRVSMPATEKKVIIPGVTIQQKKKDDREISIAELEMINARLYNQRAMLSNKLRETSGKEMVRLENCRLIDQIQKLHAEMLRNREKIRDLHKGVEPPAVIPEEKAAKTGRIVIRMQDTDYTMADLKAMSPEEIQYLREKVRQQASKARLRSRTGATEETRKHNVKKAKVKEKELALMDKLRESIKKDHGQKK